MALGLSRNEYEDRGRCKHVQLRANQCPPTPFTDNREGVANAGPGHPLLQIDLRNPAANWDHDVAQLEVLMKDLVHAFNCTSGLRAINMNTLAPLEHGHDVREAAATRLRRCCGPRQEESAGLGCKFNHW